MERSVQLAQQYRIETALNPLLTYEPGADSPPLAPKHVTAPPSRSRKSAPIQGLPSTSRVVPAPPLSTSKYLPANNSNLKNRDISDNEDDPMSPSPSFRSTSSRTPSPIRNNSNLSKKRKIDDNLSPYDDSQPSNTMDLSISYEDIILDYFISESTQIPDLLINPPSDFNPNMSIDDEGHTALHWACAMGKIRVVKLLLSAGADIFRVNHSEQTALMRSVMFSNNYDIRKFPQLYELLHRSTLNLDKHDRTVLHHVVDLALTKTKTHAARYYMECILTKLSSYPDELADVINFQDDEGESALTLAARARSKRLVKLLLDHGADSKLQNKDGKTAEDYILEDERFRSSPLLNSNHLRLHPPDTSIYAPPSHLYISETSQMIANRSINDLAGLLENLAQSYDKEISNKERDFKQAQSILKNLKRDVIDVKSSVDKLKIDQGEFEILTNRLNELESKLESYLNHSQVKGWNEFDMKVSDDKFTSKDDSNVEQECEELRKKVKDMYQIRLSSLKELIKRQKEVGTGKKMSEYRKLISSGCGIPSTEIDTVLELLLESLEAENATSNNTNNNNNVFKNPNTLPVSSPKPGLLPPAQFTHSKAS